MYIPKCLLRLVQTNIQCRRKLRRVRGHCDLHPNEDYYYYFFILALNRAFQPQFVVPEEKIFLNEIRTIDNTVSHVSILISSGVPKLPLHQGRMG